MSDVDHTKENLFLPAKELGGEEHLGKKGIIFSFNPPLHLYLGSLKYLKYNVSEIFFKYIFP